MELTTTEKLWATGLGTPPLYACVYVVLVAVVADSIDREQHDWSIKGSKFSALGGASICI
jgi:hypothetical protein